MKKQTKRLVQCESCDYSWETISRLNYVTCPKCQRKTKIENNEVKESKNGH